MREYYTPRAVEELMVEVSAATDDFKSVVACKDQAKELDALAAAFANLAGSCRDFLSSYEYYSKKL